MDGIFIYFVCGFIASLIDGCVGMAYGVSLATLLTAMGFPILHISATIHFCEVFTSFASGISHLAQGNVDVNLFKRIIFSGIVGGILGSLFLVFTRNYDLKIFISIYLLCLGFVILVKTFCNKVVSVDNNRKIIPLGFFGGFFDASGGGGWGPIVTSSLVADGYSPVKVVGTVSLAEFFVTLVQVIIFVSFVSVVDWRMTLGFILGGCIAAPLAALIVKKINQKVLMVLIALVVITVNLYLIINMLKRG